MNLPAKIALVALVPTTLIAAKAWLGCPCCGARAASSSEVTGTFVEARSASVFAGACHYNGEYTTQGREQVLAWRLTGGREGGVDLAGVEAVAVVRADRNLAESDAQRSSLVYLDEHLSPEQRSAALEWLEREHGASLGEVRQVKTGQVSVDCDGERYAVDALGLVRLEGEAMPDRACCAMPSKVWYQPAERLEKRLVGHSQVFEVRDPDFGPAFTRRDQNDAFVGRLEAAAQADCATQARRSSCCPSKQKSDKLAP